LLLNRYEEKGDDAHDSKEEHMNKKLYVGGLAFSVTDTQLAQLFAGHGKVESAKVITDRDSNRSRGFGFVEMNTQEEAEKAIASLNGTLLEGRNLTVNMSKPREDRPVRNSY
jgi:cold-inducible RNA-binding protein